MRFVIQRVAEASVAVDGEIVGTISFEPGADVYRRSGDLGYFLLEKYFSQGVMSAVVSHFCPLVFSLPDVERITAYVYAPNLASRTRLLPVTARAWNLPGTTTAMRPPETGHAFPPNGETAATSPSRSSAFTTSNRGDVE